MWALDLTPTREAAGHVCTAIGYAQLAQPMVLRAFLPSVQLPLLPYLHQLLALGRFRPISSSQGPAVTLPQMMEEC